MRRRLFGIPLTGLGSLGLAVGALAGAAAGGAPASASNGCALGNGIQHVIYIQFDNVHLRRDAPNVPSDLEQMPNLLNFLEHNGVLMNRHYTPLIAHTANDIVTSETGLYGDRQGIPEANSYGFYQSGTASFQSSFAYWTDTIGNGTFNNLDSNGQNAPAPWTPYTTAGCNVGDAATANTELEGLTPDVATVFGANSPQAAEANSGVENAYADFLGLSVHCAPGNAVCSKANGGVADVLPSNSGYTGYQALYGHKYIAPQIGGTGPGAANLYDLNGNLIADTFTGTAIPGFPGYDGMVAPVALAYTLDMQTHGIPVTQTYISAAHVDPSTGSDAGPGSAGYEGRLKQYDKAFGRFFSGLAQNGITTKNTLFVITADENDQFVGGAGVPAGCDGVKVTCSYNQIGEVDVNLNPLMQQAGQDPSTFSVHYDSAPFVYLNNQPPTGSASARDFERAMAALTVTNPLSGQNERLVNYLADPVEMQLLHMVTRDPSRTPTFVAFGKPSYWIQTQYAFCQSGQQNPAPVYECPPSYGADAWNHGTFDNQVNQSWLGMAGPGVRHLGFNDSIWSDHTDILPSILSLTGLTPGYATQGRPLFEVMTEAALPKNVRAQKNLLIELGQAYKQINAPVGQLGSDSLRYSTRGIASGTDTSDATYQSVESNLAAITSQRDALAGQMAAEIAAATFNGQRISKSAAESQILQANQLLQRMHALASGCAKPVAYLMNRCGGGLPGS